MKNHVRTKGQGQHTIDRLEEKGNGGGGGEGGGGSYQRATLKGRDRTIVNQTKYWNCFKGNSGETSQRRGGANKHDGLFRALNIYIYHLE